MVSNAQKVIKIKGTDYTAKFPTVGQLIDIEELKLSLSNGKYSIMAISQLKLHIFELDIIDAIASFAVLLPNLADDLKIKSWRTVDADLAKELMVEYKSQFLPWFKPLIDELLKIETTDEDGSTGNQQGNSITN